MEQKRRKLRIKIADLPKDQKITREEMRKIQGGLGTFQSTNLSITRPPDLNYSQNPLDLEVNFMGGIRC